MGVRVHVCARVHVCSVCPPTRCSIPSESLSELTPAGLHYTFPHILISSPGPSDNQLCFLG